MSITHNLAASSARHSTHHRGDAVPDETTDLLSALANRLRHCGSLHVSLTYTLGRQRELPLITLRMTEESGARSGSFAERPPEQRAICGIRSDSRRCATRVLHQYSGIATITPLTGGAFEFWNWSGARDLNPGPHGPEPS